MQRGAYVRERRHHRNLVSGSICAKPCSRGWSRPTSAGAVELGDQVAVGVRVHTVNAVFEAVERQQRARRPIAEGFDGVENNFRYQGVVRVRGHGEAARVRVTFSAHFAVIARQISCKIRCSIFRDCRASPSSARARSACARYPASRQPSRAGTAVGGERPLHLGQFRAADRGHEGTAGAVVVAGIALETAC